MLPDPRLKILITAGPSRTYIDPIRYISDNDRGRLAAKIATSALMSGHKVHYLCCHGTVTPWTVEMKPQEWENASESKKISDIQALAKRAGSNYQESNFGSFQEYQTSLMSLLAEKPDVVMCLTAVFGYGIEPYASKIRTDGDDLILRLHELPKAIKMVRDLAPESVLVGRKILAGVSEHTLIAESRETMKQYDCDLMLSNAWADLQFNHNRLYIMDRTSYLCIHHFASEPLRFGNSVLMHVERIKREKMTKRGQSIPNKSQVPLCPVSV
jgi:phosphopantothenoylcysteine synthetase/decarboxylase